MEETLLLEKRTKNRASSLCIGGGIRTHTVTLASDFESGASTNFTTWAAVTVEMEAWTGVAPV